MTKDEVIDAVEKFLAYMKANGKRPIAFVMEICDDDANTEQSVFSGNQESLDLACLRVLIRRHGCTIATKL